MQKPVEGLPALALFTTKSMLKNVEGKGLEKTIGAYQSTVHSTFPSYIKGGYSLFRALENTSEKAKKYKNAYVFSIAKLETDLHECSQRNPHILPKM